MYGHHINNSKHRDVTYDIEVFTKEDNCSQEGCKIFCSYKDEYSLHNAICLLQSLESAIMNRGCHTGVLIFNSR